MRYAWLEFHRGAWILLTDDDSEPAGAARRWVDRECALSALASEGWTISGPFPGRKKGNLDSKRGFYGFALMRQIH